MMRKKLCSINCQMNRTKTLRLDYIERIVPSLTIPEFKSHFR